MRQANTSTAGDIVGKKYASPALELIDRIQHHKVGIGVVVNKALFETGEIRYRRHTLSKKEITETGRFSRLTSILRQEVSLRLDVADLPLS